MNMAQELPGMVEQKLSLIQKDFDSAFACTARHVAQIATIRGWSLTLTTAYAGLLVAHPIKSPALLLPIVVVVAMFGILDGRERLYNSYNSECICTIGDIFMKDSTEAFSAAVMEYKFRDLRVRQDIPNRPRRWKAILKDTLSPIVILWYGALVGVIVATYLIAGHTS
jgi:hypothetical protein